MSAATDYLESAILNGLVRSAPLPRVPTLYLALFTGAPTDAGGGVEIATVNTGYARQPIATADASWSAPADAGAVKRIQNAAVIAFATPTGDWGTPTHAGLLDAVTGGNPWVHAAIGQMPRAVFSGDPPFGISPGAVAIDLGGMFSHWLRAALLNHLFRTATLAKPGSLYAALHTADPTPAGTGPEVAGGGYQRVAVAVADASWSSPAAAGADTRVANAGTLAYQAPTGDWGVPTHWSLRDALVGGNPWLHGANQPPDGGAPLAVLAGDNPPQFGPGALSLQVG